VTTRMVVLSGTRTLVIAHNSSEPSVNIAEPKTLENERCPNKTRLNTLRGLKFNSIVT
jgi:hypothetical protein